MRRLLEAGIEIFDVSFIFYSHFHPDHTSELVPFLFSNKYPDGNRRKIPLTLVAGRGFSEFYGNLKNVYGSLDRTRSGLLKIVELDNTARDMSRFGDFQVESLPVEHNPEKHCIQNHRFRRKISGLFR